MTFNGTYNLTQLTTAQNTVDIFKYANDVSHGVLFGMFFVAIFVILLYSLRKYEFAKSFITSSAVCFMLSLIFWLAGWIRADIMYIFLGMTAFGAFTAVISGSFKR